MKAYVIVDPYRPPGNWTLYNELTAHGIEFELVGAIGDPQSVVRSINMSHKQIVRRAQEEGWPEVLIMEEDVMFTCLGAFEWFLANKPPVFDLYLGGAYGTGDLFSERTGNAVRLRAFAGLHCYIIHSRFYERFLETPEDNHIDDQAGRGEFYVCFPFAALQYPGWSSNNRRQVDYNETIPKSWMYAKEAENR